MKQPKEKESFSFDRVRRTGRNSGVIAGVKTLVLVTPRTSTKLGCRRKLRRKHSSNSQGRARETIPRAHARARAVLFLHGHCYGPKCFWLNHSTARAKKARKSNSDRSASLRPRCTSADVGEFQVTAKELAKFSVTKPKRVGILPFWRNRNAHHNSPFSKCGD